MPCVLVQRQAPRVTAILIHFSFLLTLVSIFSIALTPNLSNCDAVTAAIVLLSFLGAGGHFGLCLLFTGTIYRNVWPRLLVWQRAGGGAASGAPAQDAAGSINADSYESLSSGGEEAEAEEEEKAPPAPLPLAHRCALASALALVLLGIASAWGLALGAHLLALATVSPRAGSGRAGLHLSQPVHLSYSADGLSHVAVQPPAAPSGNSSATEHDLWYGQGWAHARARLWQMEFQRRVGAGRLSEVVGRAGLAVDRPMRVLGVYAAAQGDYEAMPLDSPERAALEAYAEGVNAFARAATPAYLPLEFRVLGLSAVEPWAPADSLVWQKLMSWDLCGNFDLELQRFEMAYLRGVAPARVAALLPPYNYSAFPTILSAEDIAAGAVDPPDAPQGGAAQPPPAFPPSSSPPSRVQELVDAAVRAAAAAASVGTTTGSSEGSSAAGAGAPSRLWEAVSFFAALAQGNFSMPAPLRAPKFRARGGGGASNAWVVNATPSPILANDPHLQLLAPSLWYLQHLSDKASGIEVQGVRDMLVPVGCAHSPTLFFLTHPSPVTRTYPCPHPLVKGLLPWPAWHCHWPKP